MNGRNGSVPDAGICGCNAELRCSRPVLAPYTSGGDAGQRPEKQAVQLAEEALPDKDTLVRPSAALALGQSKAKQAVQQALDDSSGAVAFAAAEALTEIGDSSLSRFWRVNSRKDRKLSPTPFATPERGCAIRRASC